MKAIQPFWYTHKSMHFFFTKNYILLGLGISMRTGTHQPFHSDTHYKREEKACIALIYADFIY